ncbi:MAG: DUF2892 domain-containing protein [Gammaproteobacteria bacterium]|nr:DUF2892 domain-containing protein [Gammaproteobacteria bacterium]
MIKDLFKKNVGRIDRLFRVIGGSAMIYFGFFGNSAVTSGLSGTLLGLFGIGIFLSAVFQNCPLYVVAGINTCEKQNNNKNDI